jgi:hypothetical protein
MNRVLSVGAITALLSAGPAAAQQTVLADTPVGFNGHEGNENSEGSKIDDPAKYRLTTPITEHGGGGGMLSFNASRYFNQVVFGENQLEMAGLRVEQAEDVRGQVGNLKAEFKFLCNDGSGADDAAMRKCLSFTYHGITSISPGILADLRSLIGGNGVSAESPLTSTAARWWLQVQDDGNYVIYDSWVFDEDGNTTPKPIFDLWSLMARLDRIDAELRALEGRR